MELNASLLLLILFTVLLKCYHSVELGYKDVIFVIVNQRDPIHAQRGLDIEADIKLQTNNEATVYVTHRDLKHVGDWTIIPILPKLWKAEKGKFEWMFFGTDRTKFNVDNLLSSIRENSNETFVGRGIEDSEPTIIHHFATLPGFKYPLLASGFGLSHSLFERLYEKKKKLKRVDFSIDASHELALTIKNNANGAVLFNNPHFCLHHEPHCATSVVQEDICEGILDEKEIFFAVKTCQKFHETRIPVIKATWAKRVSNIAFFSDAYDEHIPTVKLQAPNMETGHCAKTQNIFKNTAEYLISNKSLLWVVLADDDTILSVRRIQRLVSCYDGDEAYVLGERYGYNVHHKSGYNYVTGGGGAAISRGALLKLSKSSCLCPTDSTPDDMFLLGICLQRLNITLVHLPLFHQARPEDYNREYLEIGKPISFHKHWMVDPVRIYEDWFEKVDKTLDSSKIHSEL